MKYLAFLFPFLLCFNSFNYGQIHIYTSEKLAAFLKNELDGNKWEQALNKDIKAVIKIDESNHMVIITDELGNEIEKFHYINKASIKYDSLLNAYVIRGVTNKISNKIEALVFSSPKFDELKYLGIMKAPDVNGYLPLFMVLPFT